MSMGEWETIKVAFKIVREIIAIWVIGCGFR